MSASSSDVIIKMASSSLASFQRLMSSIPRRSMYAVLPLTAGTVIIILQWRQRRLIQSDSKPKDSAPESTEAKNLKSPQKKGSKKTGDAPIQIHEDATATAPGRAPPSFREHVAARLPHRKDHSKQPLKESQPKSTPAPEAASVMERPHPKRSRFSEDMASATAAPLPAIVEPTASHLPGMGRPNSIYELQPTSKSSSDLLLNSDVEEADDEATPGSPSWLNKMTSWEKKQRRGLKSSSTEKLGAEGLHEQQSPLAEKGKTFLRKFKGGKGKMEVMSP